MSGDVTSCIIYGWEGVKVPSVDQVTRYDPNTGQPYLYKQNDYNRSFFKPSESEVLIPCTDIHAGSSPLVLEGTTKQAWLGLLVHTTWAWRKSDPVSFLLDAEQLVPIENLAKEYDIDTPLQYWHFLSYQD